MALFNELLLNSILTSNQSTDIDDFFDMLD